MVQRWSLGIDVGASATKTVLLDDGGQQCARALRKSGANFAAAAQACLEEVTAAAGVKPAVIEQIVATGYGRRSVDFATSAMVSTGYGRDRVEQRLTAVTEITCHARGCYQSFPEAVTIVDIGGQDNKVIVLDDRGDRRSFKMNRKCAAGTGAFLEEIAAYLDTPLSTLNQLAQQATGNVELGSFCTVFAKTELLKLIAHGTPLPEIVKAAFRSVTKRILEMDPLAGQVVMTGGVVAHNPVIVDLLADALGRDVRVPPHPQYTGALGAALLARDL
jgi:predicted CoA-substrate-specific enzyme activase